MYKSDFVRQLQTPSGGTQLRRSVQIDYSLTAILLTLCVIGLLVIYSATGQSVFYVRRQLTFILAGFFIMILFAQFPQRFWERWTSVIYLIGVISLIGVLHLGIEINGAQRWLDLKFTRLQPSELMKICVPLMVSAYIAKRAIPPSLKHVSAAVILISVPAILVLQQPDLGTALLISATGFFVLFLAGIRRRYLIGAVALALAALPSLWFFVMLDYQKQRVLTLLNPQHDKLGAGWNIIQSTTAIGSGGWAGKGWTQGTQSQLNFLPESHTDFIIAVLAEEFGLIGVLTLCMLYTLLIGRCLYIGLNSSTMFGRLMAGSIAYTFFIFVFVNLCMVSGLLPVVGAPLPLISYGGTAIVTLFAGFGIIMSIGNESKKVGA
ncbi:MAG: rod shape-determining protein RodA [Porticoccaceae bacterium]|nr:rod shape-determining protein RodA [Porticoccaceae bacterium]|tara:strand:+ start:4656 stop:5789 length:1134 start_codon:yes stop_codon:yes gene_type:complete